MRDLLLTCWHPTFDGLRSTQSMVVWSFGIRATRRHAPLPFPTSGRRMGAASLDRLETRAFPPPATAPASTSLARVLAHPHYSITHPRKQHPMPSHHDRSRSPKRRRSYDRDREESDRRRHRREREHRDRDRDRDRDRPRERERERERRNDDRRDRERDKRRERSPSESSDDQLDLEDLGVERITEEDYLCV